MTAACRASPAYSSAPPFAVMGATKRASIHDPVTCYAFDLLHACGYDLKGLPLTERKALLREMLPPAGPIRYSEHIEGNGIETFHAMRRLGLEGVVGKRADSVYVNGRSDSWLKVRGARTGDFVVAGWVPVKNNPDDIGALVLGEYRGDELTYCGRVGSGLGTDSRRELQTRFAGLKAAPRLAQRHRRPGPPLGRARAGLRGAVPRVLR